MFFFIVFFSTTTELESSVPFARLRLQRHRYGQIAGQEREENQFETRAGLGQKRTFGQTFQLTAGKGHDSRAQQRLRSVPVQSR